MSLSRLISRPIFARSEEPTINFFLRKGKFLLDLAEVSVERQMEVMNAIMQGYPLGEFYYARDKKGSYDNRIISGLETLSAIVHAMTPAPPDAPAVPTVCVNILQEGAPLLIGIPDNLPEGVYPLSIMVDHWLREPILQELYRKDQRSEANRARSVSESINDYPLHLVQVLGWVEDLGEFIAWLEARTL